MTIGDENFYESILVSVSQAYKFYPESSFYIYDWGFKNHQINRLKREDNVEEIVSWSDKNIDLDFLEDIDWRSVIMQRIDKDNSIKSLMKNLVRRSKIWSPKMEMRVRNIIENILDVKDDNRFESKIKRKSNVEREKSRLYAQKPYCIKDCLNRCKGKLVFLDGDAFILNKIDVLNNAKSDIVVTVRRKNEIIKSFNNCEVLNAGVIFFLGDESINKSFCREWIKYMKKIREGYCIEQTALTRLIERDNENVLFENYETVSVNAESKKVEVLVAPCEKYNFNWIEEGVDNEKVKIVHFKGGRRSNKSAKEIAKEVNIPQDVNRDYE